MRFNSVLGKESDLMCFCYCYFNENKNEFSNTSNRVSILNKRYWLIYFCFNSM